MTATIVEIDQPNLADIPAALRNLAVLIETGQEPPWTQAIVIATDGQGDLAVYGYGQVGTIEHEIGLLHLAAAQMIHTATHQAAEAE